MSDIGASARRMLAEFIGTGLLVCVIVGSGIAAQRLSPADAGQQLLENVIATVFGLGVLILVIGPVSGGHFNPVVSMADWWSGRRSGAGLSATELTAYLGAQALGGVTGAVLANIMFDQPAAQISGQHRITAGHLVGEVVATAGLILVVTALARTGRAALSAVTVAAYIGAACWFTSSNSFANPAATIGRIFSDTFTGIAPISAAAFIAAQLIGATIGFVVVGLLYPAQPTAAGAEPSTAAELAGQRGVLDRIPAPDDDPAGEPDRLVEQRAGAAGVELRQVF
ncbi:aquaporin [Nocardia sp. NPDC127526]|uniref:aquaporin n=1 Tax=Nocardia sp. NPDC127526 TaxID=3345393 RepID=UPI00364453E9